MNILIIGSGAREHAIAKAYHRSALKPALFCCGTHVNPGIADLARGYCAGSITDAETIVNQAQLWQIDLVIIGPEAPLEQGLADALWAAGIATIGPRKQSARIETSKQFARDLMKRHHIPGLPRYQAFTRLQGIEAYLHELGEGRYVIKANGLMGGKGVKVAGEHLHNAQEALTFCSEIFKLGQTCVIEEKLIGQEFSCMSFCDGKTLSHMPLVQDHKRAFVNDTGPNTGGMGSYSDANHQLPFLKESDVMAAHHINEAVCRALMSETGEPYIGILYGSFIATHLGVQVIEFNARFGDPESLNVLSLLTSDFVALSKALVAGRLAEEQVTFLREASVCKYVVPEGYPDHVTQTGIVDFSRLTQQDHLYLGSIEERQGKMMTLGSRTAAYVGVGATLAEAEAQAEAAVSAIKGPVFHRADIGTAAALAVRLAHMQRVRAS
jgi:phosphoribosylamine--glycine ligase